MAPRVPALQPSLSSQGLEVGWRNMFSFANSVVSLLRLDVAKGWQGLGEQPVGQGCMRGSWGYQAQEVAGHEVVSPEQG